MRNRKDAKAMAKSLRNSLAARNILLSHSECLEIVAKQSGFVDWNTLSAKLDVQLTNFAGPDSQSTLQSAISARTCEKSRAGQEQISCSFCGKSQHQVRTLIEGGCSNRSTTSCVFICDECVASSAQINAERIGNLQQSSD